MFCCVFLRLLFLRQILPCNDPNAIASAGITGTVNNIAIAKVEKSMDLSFTKYGCDGWRPPALGWTKTANIVGISIGYA